MPDSPITGPSPLLRAAPPLCTQRYSGSCGDLPLELLPSHRDDRFPRSATEPDPGSRRLQAGAARTGLQGSARACPEATTFPPVSTPSCEFRHVISGSLALVSPDLT